MTHSEDLNRRHGCSYGGGHKSAEQQAEVREARRQLKERVRDDWHYPPLPGHRRVVPRPQPVRRSSDEESRVAGFRFHAQSEPGRVNGLDTPIVEWRERVYSSDSEDESAQSRNSGSTNGRSEYRFDGPDDVGAQIWSRRTARKRKRQNDQAEELSWNEGLKHWTSQRDAWSSAKVSSSVDQAQIRAEHETTTSPGSSRSLESTPRTSTSSTTAEVSSAATTPDPAPGVSRYSPPAVLSPYSDVVLPVCAAILPDHPIRRRISPAMHTEIYSKIIVQARTPSVPINLTTLVSSLIAGWKADGEWPPKSVPLEPSIGRRKAKAGSAGGESSLKSGVKAVGRVLRLTGISETSSQRAKEEG
ncbi:hypothetical protein LTR97_002191 [Elasticomyces elasticus]|uniref:Gag1-like clamp domain-containing protein n=1 Tax=Elasticomyces elasticus TaxID=574655 RepID=A0AAN7WGR1_9PEZI|nr:hypothetical protein LTR97_002191 [Elasticomyces elasticus]